MSKLQRWIWGTTLGLVFASSTSYIVSAEPVFDWMQGSISVEAEQISSENSDDCEPETAMVANFWLEGQVHSLCVWRGDTVDIAKVTDNPSGSEPIVVRAHGHSYFTATEWLNGMFAFAKGTDTYVQYQMSPDVSGQHFYFTNDLSASLISGPNDSAGRVGMYWLNYQNMRYPQLYMEGISPVAADSIKISENGRYVLVQFPEELIVYDSQDDSVRAVFVHGMDIQRYRHEDDAIAISDNGRYVYVGRYQTIVDMYGGCGPNPRTISLWYVRSSAILPDGLLCPHRNISTYINNTLGEGVYTAYDVAFTDNNVIEMTMRSDDNLSLIYRLRVTLSESTATSPGAPSTPSVPLEYLALGDSYSSGEGDIDKGFGNWYLSGTEQGGGCHISGRSYPFLVGAYWNINSDAVRSVACSGALVARDYNVPLDTYLGQDNELDDLTVNELEDVRNVALTNYRPGIVPQLEFVRKHKPGIVTVTGSGNDVGFADIIRYCATDPLETLAFDYSCEYVDGGILNDILNDSIDTQFRYIRGLIEDIKQASPGVKIYYIGYPSFIGGPQSICALNSGILDKKERDMINSSVTRLNSVIRKAAVATGVQYVDIESALNGGRLCEGSEYMTGVWDNGIGNTLKDDMQNMFHPNSRGHEKMAARIKEQITNPYDDYHPEEPSVVVVEPGVPTSRARIVKDAELSGQEMLEIELLPDDAPGSTDVVVTAFSTPVHLGHYRTSEDGSLEESVELPQTITNGTHLIVLDLKDDSGNVVERKFEFITVSGRETIAGTDSNSSSLSDDSRAVYLASSSVAQDVRDEETGILSGLATSRPVNEQMLDNPGDGSKMVDRVIEYVISGILIAGMMWGIWIYGKKAETNKKR